MNDVMINLRLQALSMALNISTPDNSAQDVRASAEVFYEFITEDDAPTTKVDPDDGNVVSLN